jgi:hypothetical protein
VGSTGGSDRESEGDSRVRWGPLEIAQLACILVIIFLGGLVANNPKIAHLFDITSNVPARHARGSTNLPNTV